MSRHTSKRRRARTDAEEDARHDRAREALAAWRRAVPGRMTEIQARGDYTVLLYEGDQMHTPCARATAIDIATATEDALAEHARRAAATG